MDLFKSINITKRIERPKEDLNIDKFLLKSSPTIQRHNKKLGSYLLLETQKSKIDYIHKNIWLNISFLSNPYEYIHPKVTKYYKNDRIVSMDKPISRAFYKMWEIMNIFPILKDKLNGRNLLYYKEKPHLDTIKTAHLCEGPGGFIEALIKKRGHYNDEIHGLTIMCENKNKLFSDDISGSGTSAPFHINIHYGDITKIETTNKFKEKFKDKKAYIVTADGGFEDENREYIQEQIHSQLIFSEILTALSIQSDNGRFICKIYDINTNVTAFMIKMLTYFYKDVYIFKPTASRPINSERYLVCLDFLGISDKMLEKLYEIKKIWTKIDNTGGLSRKEDQEYIYSLYDDKNFNYEDISKFNFLYTNQQLKYINFALGSISNMHESHFLEKIKYSQIEYSVEWCLDHDIPIHQKYKHYYKEIQEPDETVYKSILKAINNDNIEALERHSISTRVNKNKIQLLIYIYLQKKYDYLQYFIKNIRLSNLLYYLNCDQIIDLLKRVEPEDRQNIVVPITKICMLYINKPENSHLKDYLLSQYKSHIQQIIIKPPLNRLKYFIKFEKFDILKQLSEDYYLSIKIMRYALYYNTSFKFLKRLHELNSHYNFTEDDLVRTIKYGNFKMFEYICSVSENEERSKIKIYNKYIFNYVIKYDFPINQVLKILNMHAISPNYNIYKLMKRDTKDIEVIFNEFNKLKLNHPNIKIYHFINDNYKTSNELLLLLYKHKVLNWTIQDYNFLKNKLNRQEMQGLIKLIDKHIYKGKLML